VKSSARFKRDASATVQLEAELEYLAGRLPGVVLKTPPGSFPSMKNITVRTEAILRDPEVAPLLSILGEHNRQSQLEPGRRTPRKNSFLLSPHLIRVLASVQARSELGQMFPVLDQPAAKIRAHFRTVAGDCKTLVELLRKGPQPHVALAGKTRTNPVLKGFPPLTDLFGASDDLGRQIISFTELLERAALWFDVRAAQIPRAKQNKQTSKGALRFRAAEILVSVFRKRLNQPYYNHVAILASKISGTKTYADFVKKVDARQTRSSDSG
jgi:hypothetical protein